MWLQVKFFKWFSSFTCMFFGWLNSGYSDQLLFHEGSTRGISVICVMDAILARRRDRYQYVKLPVKEIKMKLKQMNLLICASDLCVCWVSIYLIWSKLILWTFMDNVPFMMTITFEKLLSNKIKILVNLIWDDNQVQLNRETLCRYSGCLQVDNSFFFQRTLEKKYKIYM